MKSDMEDLSAVPSPHRSSTNGPWSTTDTWWVAALTGQPICLVDYALTDKAEATANAKLIAAAPELLAACQRALAESEEDGEFGIGWKATDMLRAAVDKATK